MITKEVKLEVWKIYIKWLMEYDFIFHLTKLETLIKRLKNGSQYPFRWVLELSTYIDKLTIDTEKRKDLLNILKDIPLVI